LLHNTLEPLVQPKTPPKRTEYMCLLFRPQVTRRDLIQ
jgi:hypothetical protein